MPTVRNCVKALIIRDGKLLCIECSDSDGAYYKLPGGGQEPGETLIETLRRECLEEVSVEVIAHGLRFITECLHCRGAIKHQIEFIFICTLPDGAQPRQGSVTDDSQIGVAWLPLSQLHTFRLYPDITDVLSDCPSDTFEPPVYLGETN